MTQVFEQELLVVVLFLLVDVKVSTVEVKEAVRYLVACQCAHHKLALITTEHPTAGDTAHCLRWSLRYQVIWESLLAGQRSFLFCLSRQLRYRVSYVV